MKRILWTVLLYLIVPTLADANCNDNLWICKLKPYEPNPNLINTNNTSPECDGPAPSGIARKIKDAYDAIPNTLSKVKNDLCQVQHIFVTSAASHSWGRYNDPSVHPNDNPGASYIPVTTSDINRTFVSRQDEHYVHFRRSDPLEYSILVLGRIQRM
jgi:hypothetical protein